MKRMAASTIWTGSTSPPRIGQRDSADCMHLLFPGFFEESRLEKKDVPGWWTGLLSRIGGPPGGRDREEPAVREKSRRGHRVRAPLPMEALVPAARAAQGDPHRREAAYQGDPAALSLRGDHPRLPLRPRDLAAAFRSRALRPQGAAAAADDHRIRARAHRDRHPSRAPRSAPIFSSTTARESSSARPRPSART
jgi:hypothetical protein